MQATQRDNVDMSKRLCVVVALGLGLAQGACSSSNNATTSHHDAGAAGASAGGSAGAGGNTGGGAGTSGVTDGGLPPESSFPNASTTGPAAGGYSLTTRVDCYAGGAGFIEITDNNFSSLPWVKEQANGTLLIQGVDFYYSHSPGNGNIMVDLYTTHPVHVIGCRFTGYTQTLLHAQAGAAPQLLVSYCLFRGDPNSTPPGHIANPIGTVGGNGEISHCNVSGYASGSFLTGNNWYFHDNYIHDAIYKNGDHTDGVNVPAGTAAAYHSNVRIIHNTIFNPLPQTSCVNNGGYTDHLTVQDNLFAGGGYTVYPASFGPITNERIVGNYFSTRYHPQCGGFGFSAPGPSQYGGAWGTNGDTWSNNYWYDGPNAGTLVPPPP